MTNLSTPNSSSTDASSNLRGARRRDSGSPAKPPATMRAAVIAAPGKIELRELPLPEPGPRQVRVRLEGCGVCGSNVPVWEGRPWFEYPLEPGAPGHEGWGVVDAVGSEVQSLAVGDRVGALSYHAFAEYDTVDEDAAVVLPDELAELPFPAEPLACAMNVLERSDVQPGQVVTVIGVGFLGSLLIQMMTRRGARVIAVSRRRSALEWAERMGAIAALPLTSPDDVQQQVAALSGGDGCPRVIEATGFQEPLDLAAALVAVRGKLVIAGYHQDGLRQVNLQQWNWRGIDVINAHERDPAIYTAGMRRAAAAVVAGQLDPAPLLTHTFPLSELGAALDAAVQRPGHFMKAVVRP
ncbi:MDR/zinc-dependent alcohol dehydrogenase-like family protein [Candidatus Laterigemmans baculatus]|uniref:MDR/zinc-dependent alcohol dehydrogenase-like family protein n=1 Tax=Candidatus Laterigemmans baculatus TaxID=2770505 RepID=UPI00193C85F2|nr:zinc-binding dehydrogenase [Candidatus Laterigemmans baculatus]